jgi:hypothetical protein
MHSRLHHALHHQRHRPLADIPRINPAPARTYAQNLNHRRNRRRLVDLHRKWDDMVHLKGQSSNRLFDELTNWEALLMQKTSGSLSQSTPL